MTGILRINEFDNWATLLQLLKHYKIEKLNAFTNFGDNNLAVYKSGHYANESDVREHYRQFLIIQDFLHDFNSYYIQPFGEKQVEAWIEQTEDKALQSDLYCLFNEWFDFKDTLQSEFQDYLKQINLSYLWQTVEEYVPYDFYIIRDFMLRHKEDIRICAIVGAVFTGFYNWEDELTDQSNDIERVKTIITCLRNNKLKNVLFSQTFFPLFLKTLNSIFENTNRKYRFSKSDFSQIAGKGKLFLPWKCVTFQDGYINFCHPSEYDKRTQYPFVYSCPKSKKAFNEIKSFFASQKMGLLVKVNKANNRVVGVDNIDYLLQCVDILDERVRNPHQVKSAGGTKRLISKPKTDTEIRNRIAEINSIYLTKLCNSHISTYPIIYCPELRSNMDFSQNDEDSFIFTIKDPLYVNHYRVVYENILEKNATYVFIVKAQNRDEVIRMISNYFASTEINKRKNIQQFAITLGNRVKLFFKVQHRNFSSWKTNVFE